MRKASGGQVIGSIAIASRRRSVAIHLIRRVDHQVPVGIVDPQVQGTAAVCIVQYGNGASIVVAN